MKVLVAFVVALGSVAALGSGPYLPSGWRPKGPAFLLPTEVQKSSPQPQVQKQEATQPSSQTSANPQTQFENLVDPEPRPEQSSENSQEVIQESEASGSDFLREYGPPQGQDSFKTVTGQALPDLNTERPFVVIETRIAPETPVSEEEVKDTIAEAKTTQELVPESEVNEGVKDQTSTTAEVEQNEEIGINEVAVSELISEVTTENVEGVTFVEETTAQNAVETEVIKEETDLRENSVTESEVTERGSLEYLPVADDEIKLNQLDDSSIEYLPPVVDAGENIGEGIPLFKAKLETGSPVVDAILEYLPPAEAMNGESSPKDQINVQIVSTEVAEELKKSDSADENNFAVTEDKAEESSGLEPVPKEQEPMGFREYGPPKSADTEEKTDAERIENNETRRRLSRQNSRL